jgi:hypothetical protein
MTSCPVFIISLALSLLVLLGGLFLLAYAKKEGLGKMTKIASYVAVIFGTICFVGGLIGSLMCGSCHKGKCDKDGMKCTKEVRIECHEGMSKGGHCDKNATEKCCKEGMDGNAAHCEKNATEKCCKEGKEECSESKCEKGMEAEHCKKDGKDCCKEAIQKCNKEEASKK